jgi:hypothetical protein
VAIGRNIGLASTQHGDSTQGDDMTRVVVFGLMGLFPMGGMAWQVLNHMLGFQQLQCDVFYVENTGCPPYSFRRQSVVDSADDNLAFLDHTFRLYDLQERWSYYDCLSNTWNGMSEGVVKELLEHSDVIVNLCGGTRPDLQVHRHGCLVYIDTDPGVELVGMAERERRSIELLSAHDVHFTYGWNIGDGICPLPTAGIDWRRTHPPVVTALWHIAQGHTPRTWRSIGTYQNKGKDFTLNGETYLWSKHLNFERVMELPSRVSDRLELALMTPDSNVKERFLSHGWTITDPYPISKTPEDYRDYITEARGEFSVEKDSYVRMKSGWFSDRTVCFLAAGRPCVVQDTGFGYRVPCGQGLLSWNSSVEAAEAMNQVGKDYAAHARAAERIAREYFDASVLLPDILDAAGVPRSRPVGV